MNCTNCGAEMPESNEYCGKCGTRRAEAAVAAHYAGRCTACGSSRLQPVAQTLESWVTYSKPHVKPAAFSLSPLAATVFEEGMAKPELRKQIVTAPACPQFQKDKNSVSFWLLGAGALVFVWLSYVAASAGAVVPSGLGLVGFCVSAIAAIGDSQSPRPVTLEEAEALVSWDREFQDWAEKPVCMDCGVVHANRPTE